MFSLRVVGRRILLSLKEVGIKMMLNWRVLMRKKWSRNWIKQGEKEIVCG